MMTRTSKFPIPKPLIDTLAHLNEKDSLKFELPSFSYCDLVCSLDFLKQYSGNNATFESYRREVERLLQWSCLIAKKSILEIKR